MRMALAIALLLGLVRQPAWAGSTEATKPETGKVDAAYQQSFNKWKAELVDDLKQNWLTLAGLYWLKPGTNTFGSDAGNSIVVAQWFGSSQGRGVRPSGERCECQAGAGREGNHRRKAGE